VVPCFLAFSCFLWPCGDACTFDEPIISSRFTEWLHWGSYFHVWLSVSAPTGCGGDSIASDLLCHLRLWGSWQPTLQMSITAVEAVRTAVDLLFSFFSQGRGKSPRPNDPSWQRFCHGTGTFLEVVVPMSEVHV
jgi:hypothetical protein